MTDDLATRWTLFKIRVYILWRMAWLKAKPASRSRPR